MRSLVEDKPDAMTYCILAEQLRRRKKHEEATEAALKAMDAPTLYPGIRPYACAFAAALLAENSFYVSDSDERTELLDRANELVRRRLTMGPLNHYATCQPLARIAETVGDWPLLQQVVDELEVHFAHEPEVLRSAVIVAYVQEDYLRAIELAERCITDLKDEKEVDRANNILKSSILASEEKLKAARESTLPGDG